MDYLPNMINSTLNDFFYDLIFNFRSIVYDIEMWLYDEFELQLSQDHVSFIIAFFIMVFYSLAIIFTVILFYKAIKFIFGLFVR